MSVCSRGFLILILMCSCIYGDAATDMLKLRILKYNHLENKKEAIAPVDSQKIFYNIGFINHNNKIAKSQSIIKKRKSSTNYFLFFILLSLVVLISIFRRNLNLDFNNQLAHFFKLKFKRVEEYSSTIAIAIHLLFAGVISYFITSIITNIRNQYDDSWIAVYKIVLLCVLGYVLLKYVIHFILSHTFYIRDVLNRLNHYRMDLLYIYICLSLPVAIAVSVRNDTNYFFINSAFILFFLFLYLYSIIKVMYNEMNIIQTSVIKFALYFYIVEFIPLILLLKYLRNYFIVS